MTDFLWIVRRGKGEEESWYQVRFEDGVVVHAPMEFLKGYTLDELRQYCARNGLELRYD